MASNWSRWAVLTAVAGLGVVALGAAPAAARPAKSVVSDNVKFKAVVSHSGTTFTFKSPSCMLVSDGETKPYSCQMAGQFTASAGGDTGSATLVSGDGTITWKYTLTCTSSTCKTVIMKGAGVEADKPENGKPSPKYPATMSGTWTSTSSTTFVGSVLVSESSTAP